MLTTYHDLLTRCDAMQIMHSGRHSTWGCSWQGRGDTQGARAAFQRAMDSGHTDIVPKAVAHLRRLASRQRSGQTRRTSRPSKPASAS